jgi:16S rRNA (cytosine967-C5)-methyltransferase
MSEAPSQELDQSKPPHSRDLLHQRIAEQAHRFPDLSLSSMDSAGLESRDADLSLALEREIYRRWLTIRALVSLFLENPFERLQGAAQAGLLVGGAQLLFFDRIPAHAAINESVGWVRRKQGKNPAGLVNAVLRRLSELVAEPVESYNPRALDQLPLSDGRGLRLERPVLPTDPIDRLAIVTSHPLSACRHWLMRREEPEVVDWCLHSLVQPPIILNARHADSPLPADLVKEHDVPGHFVFEGTGAQLRELLAGRSDLWVQDSASSELVEALRDREPELILDLCAGRGTKTRQLDRLCPNSRLVATDIDDARRADLATVFAENDHVTVIEPADLDQYYGKVEAVLIDAPCSNSGVLPRRIEAKYRLLPDRLSSIRNVQRQITADSLRLLRGDGMLLYATCSGEHEENEGHLEWIQRWHDKHLLASRRLAPRGLPGEDRRGYSDGSFWGLLG